MEKLNSEKPVVAIVGRPNVGKSTFFNRVAGERKAIESEIPGTTRDRLYFSTEWCGKPFTLIDTAGILDDVSEALISELTRESVDIAIDQADIIIFLIDQGEILSEDREIAKTLRKSNKKIFLVANKADNQEKEVPNKAVFSLGFGEPQFISAISGRGVADFLDLMTADFSSEVAPEKESPEINVAIAGRPNVGKSTLLNSLTGENKAIVSEIPGTTRDTTDAIIEYKSEKIRLVDTAGIRRRGKIEQGIEKFSIIRTTKAIESSNVVVVMIDAEEGLTNQDAHIIGEAKDLGKSIIVAINKFDLWDEDEEDDIKTKMSLMLGILQNDLAFIPFAPAIFISAKTPKNTEVLLKKIVEVYKQRFIQVDEESLKQIIKEASERNPQLPRIIYFYQEKTNPIVFKLVCKNPKDFHFSHLRYLENVLRDNYPFTGTPIFIDLIKKQK